MSTAFGRRGYAGGAVVTSLLVDVTNSTTSLSTVLASTFPAANFHIVIDEGIAGFEEKIFVGTRTGNNFTGCVRGEDGTAGVAHVAGATIRHILTAQDIDEANAVASVLTTKGDLAIKKAGGATTGWDRLPVGADGRLLVGRSGQALGVAYEALPAELLTAIQAAAVDPRYVLSASTAWTDFTPTLVVGVTVTKTITYARYYRIGRMVVANVLLTATSTGTASNPIVIGLPFAAADPVNTPVGSFFYQDTGTALYTGAAIMQAASAVAGNAYGAAAFMGQSTPTVTVVNTDLIGYQVMYEAAT